MRQEDSRKGNRGQLTPKAPNRPIVTPSPESQPAQLSRLTNVETLAPSGSEYLGWHRLLLWFLCSSATTSHVLHRRRPLVD